MDKVFKILEFEFTNCGEIFCETFVSYKKFSLYARFFEETLTSIDLPMIYYSSLFFSEIVTVKDKGDWSKSFQNYLMNNYRRDFVLNFEDVYNEFTLWLSEQTNCEEDRKSKYEYLKLKYARLKDLKQIYNIQELLDNLTLFQRKKVFKFLNVSKLKVIPKTSSYTSEPFDTQLSYYECVTNWHGNGLQNLPSHWLTTAQSKTNKNFIISSGWVHPHNEEIMEIFQNI
jgi:hypothetical protein